MPQTTATVAPAAGLCASVGCMTAGDKERGAVVLDRSMQLVGAGEVEMYVLGVGELL